MSVDSVPVPGSAASRAGAAAMATIKPADKALVTPVPAESEPRESVQDVALDVSFDRFFADEFDGLARALALTTGNPELGRDAAAEGMARAYQRWSKISGYDSPGGWVYRVGLNWARSRRRKWAREVHIVNAPEKGADATAADTSLAAALADLPIKLRSVIVLRYYLDLDVAGTATALGIAEGTVKSRMRRALDRLALQMEDSHGNR